MLKEILKECSHHGETLFVLEARNYYRCKKCRSENVTKHRQRLKQRAVDYKGGCCQSCGYKKTNSALVFHHIDPATKDFAIAGRGITRSWEKVKKEINKCVLVCHNCHAEIHEGILDISRP
jgi:5-methylcytosine-specific restriction endonuclease McrA